MFVSRRRDPTEAELKRRPSLSAEKAGNYGCAILIMGLGPALLGWIFLGWLLRKNGITQPIVPLIGGILLGMVCCVWVLVGLRKQFREHQKRSGGVRDNHIEEWEIEARRVLQLVPLGDDEPVLAFEIDDSRCLLLKGQWLRDNEIYGAPEHVGDPYEDYLNGLQPPKAFPTLKFTLERWPAHGNVTAIRPQSDYIEPKKSAVQIKKEHYFRDSELLKGEVSDLQKLLDEATRA